MDTNMIEEYHNCLNKSRDEEYVDKCKQEFFKQFLESNFELIQNRPLLLPGQTMYGNSIEEANAEIGIYEESQRNYIGLPTLEENDDDLESIFNKIRDKKLTKKKPLRTKKNKVHKKQESRKKKSRKARSTPRKEAKSAQQRKARSALQRNAPQRNTNKYYFKFYIIFIQ